MALKPQAERLRLTLEQLSHSEVHRDHPRLAALARGIAAEIDTSVPIELPNGERPGQTGYRLRDTGERPMWLLPDGRLLLWDNQPGSQPVCLSAAEPQLNMHSTVRGLRWLAVVAYLRCQPLALSSGLEALATVSDLLAVAWEVDWRGREIILAALVEALEQKPAWERCGLRLKAGFERAMVDAVPAVRALATRGLVLLALDGYLADRDAARTLELLLRAPREDVRRLALELLDGYPPAALYRHRLALTAALREDLLAPDQAIRSLAAHIMARISEAQSDRDLVVDLSAPEPQRRAAALSRLAGADRGSLPLAMPYVLDAAGDESEVVRQAALEVLEPLLDSAEPEVRERVIISLLESGDARLIDVGLTHLRAQADCSAPCLVALRRAVDGPQAVRAAAVAIL